MDGASCCPDSTGAVKESTLSSSCSIGGIVDENNVPGRADCETRKEQDDSGDRNPTAVSCSVDQVFDANANKSMSCNDNRTSSQDIDSLNVNLIQATNSGSEYQSPLDSSSIPSGHTATSSADSGGDETDTSSAVKEGITDGASHSTVADEIIKKPLNEALNDAGQFSYVALCSINLALLFEDQWNKDWKEKAVRCLVKHMKLPKKTGDTMLMFMSTSQDKQSAVIFAEGLLNDPCLVKPQLVPQDLIGHALSSGQYDARSRVLALRVASLMGVQETEVHDFEATVVSSFIQEEVELSEEEQKEKQKRAKMKKVKRFAMIGAAAVGGGALIGLTGGLAAPLIASAGVALLGGSVGFLGTAAGVAVMASVFGAAGAGLTGFKMKKRVGAIEEFEFDAVSDEKDLHVTIAISGWLTKDTLTYENVLYDNFSVPWLTLASSKEVYCLRWESKYLLALGEALSLIINKMLTMAAKEALKMTVLAGLVVAFALPATAYTSLVAIDNPWSIVTNRAAQAGKQLAEVLLSRQQGKRPVTLIGFSMGARVIYFCLKELANRKGCEGIIQDAVLLGAPVPSTLKYWKPFARVVAGRIINGYCRGDWLLQFIYRAASVQMIDIAGLEPVAWKDRRMVNVDLTDIVNGHFDYAEKMDDILKHLGLRTRATLVSPNLAKLTKTPVGQEDGHPDRTSSSTERETHFAMIDASDLILSANDPPTTDTRIPHSVSGLAVTGQNRSEPDQACAKTTGDSCPAEQKAVFAATGHGLEVKLPEEMIGEEVARLQDRSISSEGFSSENGCQDVEVGEEPSS